MWQRRGSGEDNTVSQRQAGVSQVMLACVREASKYAGFVIGETCQFQLQTPRVPTSRWRSSSKTCMYSSKYFCGERDEVRSSPSMAAE